MVVEDFHKQPTLVDIKGEEESSELPEKIGKYKVESLLSKGGMSLVYLGIHPELKEPMILKVLSKKYVAHQEMVSQFMQEARIIELTDHPNIVKIYGHGTWEGGVYIAMEFIQGLSLREMIMHEAMSLRRSLQIVMQIAEALTHLHVHGIIHRDLKPENILLTAQGGIKVIDFGISQLYSQIEDRSPTMMGTPVYMSPEQKLDPLNVGFTSDIYSLGILTYELVLGRLSHGQIHLALLPKGLQKIVAKTLMPNPKDRYEDIVDFIKALASYMGSEQLKQDMRGVDYLSELNESLISAKKTLLPQGLPKWPFGEIYLTSNSNSAISSLYYDFFDRGGGIFHIIFGESFEIGVEGLLSIALLKGMVSAAIEIIPEPKELVRFLNREIIRKMGDTSFSFSCLTLDLSQELFSYISCGYAPLWHLTKGGKKAKRLLANNLALGLEVEFEVMSVSSNWDVGDTLIWHSYQATQNKQEEVEKEFTDALQDISLLPAKNQVETLFRKVTHQKGEKFLTRPITIFSVVRRS